jgi:hypothetical protein
MIVTDATERTLESSCYFNCGFTDRNTLSQTILKDLEKDTGFYSLPVVVLMFYLSFAVTGTLHIHDCYTANKTETKHMTLLSIQILLAGYSGAAIVATLVPHRWPLTSIGTFLAFLSSWVFSGVVIAYEFYRSCVKCVPGPPCSHN